MGMYDYLNNISRNIEQNQVDIKKSQEHQKRVEYIQNELESALFGALQEYIKEYNYNIYNEDIKSMAIETVLNNNNLKLYNPDYTIQYLNKKYYAIARQVEQIEKKQNANKEDYKKQIAIEKWQMQKQVMQQKLNEKTQKEAEKQRIETYRQQQLRQQQIHDITETTLKIIGKILVFTMKATLYMILAPLAIIGLFFGGFCGGLIKLK